jgi:hypothetical protein
VTTASHDCNEPDQALLDRYARYRDAVAAEAGWSANRTTWLVTANAFFATALAILGASTADHLRHGALLLAEMLPWGAMIINAGTLWMLWVAEVVTRARLREYEQLATHPDTPYLLGTPMAHLVGTYVPIGIAAILALAWLAIAVASVV